MGYTDLWSCKRCGTMPEIVMVGKNFRVECRTCNSDKVNVHANNIDQVVAEWNRVNDPHRRTLGQRIRDLFRRS